MLRLSRPVNPDVKLRSPFGYRIHPISKAKRLHRGHDYAGEGPIYAAADGIVTKTGFNGNKRSGYGHYVYINHSSSKHLRGYSTLYAHMLEPAVVKVGDRVRTADHIGFIGSTGASTGPHLHFEVRNGSTAIDPTPFFGTTIQEVLKVNGRLDRPTRIEWQTELKRQGFYKGVLDGILGPISVTSIQLWCRDGMRSPGVGTSQDYVAITSSWNRQTRVAVQHKIGASPIDGIFGRVTYSRLQTYLNGMRRG